MVPEHIHEAFRHDRGTSKCLAARDLKASLDDCGLARQVPTTVVVSRRQSTFALRASVDILRLFLERVR